MYQSQAAGNEVVEDAYKLLPKDRDWGGNALHLAFFPIALRAAWFMLPSYLGIKHATTWPLVVLGLNIMAMIVWRLAKPGKVRENMMFIKVAAALQHISLIITLIMSIEHHFRLRKRPVLSEVIAPVLAQQYGIGEGPLRFKLSLLEALIEGACWTIMSVASYFIAGYILGTVQRARDMRARVEAEELAKKERANRPAWPAATVKVESEDSEDEDAVVVKGGSKAKGPVRRKA